MVYQALSYLLVWPVGMAKLNMTVGRSLQVDLLRSFGAIVEQVRPVSIVNRGHFVNRARAAAEEHNKNVRVRLA
jgi:hypothetical protein